MIVSPIFSPESRNQYLELREEARLSHSRHELPTLATLLNVTVLFSRNMLDMPESE